jgi:hypothetical protein
VQLYSVTFITPALGAHVLTKGVSRIEWWTMGLTQIVLGLFLIIGVILVDASVHRVKWSAIRTWTWLALFAGMLAVDVWMVEEARKK